MRYTRTSYWYSHRQTYRDSNEGSTKSRRPLVLLQSPLQDGTSRESKESYRESYTIYQNAKMAITYPKIPGSLTKIRRCDVILWRHRWFSRKLLIWAKFSWRQQKIGSDWVVENYFAVKSHLLATKWGVSQVSISFRSKLPAAAS